MAAKWQRVGKWQEGMKGSHNYQVGLTVSNGARTAKVTGDCADSEQIYNQLYRGEEVALPRLDALLAYEDARDAEMEASER